MGKGQKSLVKEAGYEGFSKYTGGRINISIEE